jgi:hypothetical protein
MTEKKPIARKRVVTPKPKTSLKKEVAVRKEKLEATKAATPISKYQNNELRKGSVLCINSRKPNKKGHMTSRMYQIEADAKDGIVTGRDTQNPNFKIKVYSMIQGGQVRFPGLGNYSPKRVGYIVNP